MKKIVLSFLLVSSTIFTSCKTDDEVVAIKKLPKKISSVNGSIEFGYSTSGQLVNVKDKESETTYTETIFTYDNTGKLTKFVNIYKDSNGTETESFLISYPAANQARITDEDNDYTIVNFNEKGDVLSFNNFGDLTTFSYDGKGNIVKIEEENSTITASYNNDQGILSAVSSPKWVLLLTDFNLYNFAANNPITTTAVSQYNGTTTTYSETYSYPVEHIISGFPTRMSVNYNDNGSASNELFTINY